MRRRRRAWTRCGRTWALSSSREGQTFGGESLFVRYVNFVKLPHTVFALPFALLGLLVASREVAVTWRGAGPVGAALPLARVLGLRVHRLPGPGVRAQKTPPPPR